MVIVPGTAATATAPATNARALVMAGGPGAFAAPVSVDLGVPSAAIVGNSSADVDGDGREDLVLLTRVGTGPLELRVLKAGATTYAAPVVWWSSATAGPALTGPVRLHTGDFDADGRADAAILSTPPPPLPGIRGVPAPLTVMLSSGAAFAPGRVWWTANSTITRTNTYVADVSGDGRADLVIEEPVATGVRYVVAASHPVTATTPAGFSVPREWLAAAADLAPATMQTTITDIDRDGRDDVVLATPDAAGTGMRLVNLRSTGTVLTRSNLWSSPATAPVPFASVKLSAGDLNADGYGDVLLYQKLAAVGTAPAGTQLTALLSNGSTLAAPPATLASTAWRTDPALDWGALRPY
jgi:hypothetical protein